MSPRFLVEYRPTKRDPKRPFVILMDAHPKPVTIARVESEAEAKDKAHRLGLQLAANRAASLLDGFD